MSHLFTRKPLLHAGVILILLLTNGPWVNLHAEGREEGAVGTFWGFFNGENRNRENRERILNVLSHDDIISFDKNGSIRIKDQQALDSLYDNLVDSGKLSRYGYTKTEAGNISVPYEDRPISKRTASTDFWNSYFRKKDMNTVGKRDEDGESSYIPVLDPFATDGKGLSTTIHNQLSAGADENDAVGKYAETCGTLGSRGIDVLDHELRKGTAAGAGLFIKSMDLMTGGQSRKAVEWAEQAAELAEQVGENPQAAAKEFITRKLREEAQSQLTETLKKQMGEDRYNEMMEKYEKYGTEQQRTQKMFKDLHKITGDSKYKEAAELVGKLSSDKLAEEAVKKILPPELGGEKKEPASDKEAKDTPSLDDKQAEKTNPDNEAEKPGHEKETVQKKPEDPGSPETDPESDGKEGTGETPGGEKDEGTDDQTIESSEGDPQMPPSDLWDEGDSKQEADGNTTVVKGYGEGADGSRIVSTETRDADGNVINTSDVEIDAEGNEIGRTTYEGGTGEGLKEEEAGNQGEWDEEKDLEEKHKALEEFAQRNREKRQKETDQDYEGMEVTKEMDEAQHAGDDDRRQARTERNQAGEDARDTENESNRIVAEGDKENSWGKAIGDAVEDGFTTGARTMGQEFGNAAAEKAIDNIWEPEKPKPVPVSTSGGKSASGSGSGGGSAGGAPASGMVAGNEGSKPSSASGGAVIDDSVQEKTKPKTPTAPTAATSEGSVYCPDCGGTNFGPYQRPPGAPDHVKDRQCLNCKRWGGIQGTPPSAPPVAPPPPNNTPTPVPKKYRDGCGVKGCGATVTYSNEHYLYGSVYHCANGHSIKGVDVIKVEIK